MIEYRQGDLLKQSDIDVICHQANCFCVMGGGIALQIAKQYPMAKEADDKTIVGDKSKLGTCSYAYDHYRKQHIVNMYSQYAFGEGLQTNYEALKKCLLEVRDEFCSKNLTIGFPKYLGCGLAGGDWEIVHNLLKSIFDNVGRVDIVEFIS